MPTLYGNQALIGASHRSPGPVYYTTPRPKKTPKAPKAPSNWGRGMEYAAQAKRQWEQQQANLAAQKKQFASMAANYTGKAKQEYAQKQKSKGSGSGKVSRSAVARRVGAVGVVGPKAPPPPDPLDVLRGEYDKYIQGVYGGLGTSLEGIRSQYKTRSEELAARLKQTYDEAANVAGQTATSTQTGLDEFAKRMGLEPTTQGRDVSDWMATNERLKSLNATNRASSLATNDVIRTNYYDFLVDKISSAKGMEAQSRAGLNDIFAQAQLQRLQMQQQAAAAAASARRRSSRGGGGGGGSSGVKLGTSQTSQSTNEELASLFNSDPMVRQAMLQNDPVANLIMYGPSGKPRTLPMGPGSKFLAEQRKKAALAYMVASAKQGGPRTSSKTTSSGKY